MPFNITIQPVLGNVWEEQYITVELLVSLNIEKIDVPPIFLGIFIDGVLFIPMEFIKIHGDFDQCTQADMPHQRAEPRDCLHVVWRRPDSCSVGECPK